MGRRRPAGAGAFGATLMIACLFGPVHARLDATAAAATATTPSLDPPLLPAFAPPAWLFQQLIDPATQAPALAAEHVSDPSPPVRGFASPTPGMRPLYLALGVLQGADVYTTRVALASGAREANPLLAGIADKPAALIAVKAAATFGTVYFVERMRLRHPGAAAITMAAIDAAYVVLVVRNARLAGHVRAPTAR
jgi:hypothetical protein